ncbi:MAG TPA: acyl-CoA thioester hydrolase/BAAT C-terminal domain-containing protein [Haliscomenobacter sp.]|mgnify:CR=1 FL=1|uniref:acyl-CoA thioester hydrolase/BAAT C-terminal domain-containing protein n=1 Tax=Haliscomenobacter sp. TaxID=2717303 RepID=UPI002CFEF9DE|nr:acyl-CoA thioester hydrolase/BAAT C-terminal domain-containing protein [Haliscomenobacter sp.]HOY18715.1 acyl-CoA thioester hydrolase/BAAT C-terminal domain-containing protein [Haliscomenobacter sp.]HPH20172.1 acyl-CoA thioester hydrolase/BAAT C-terminal domain-containing protein [Haliscomenobacter sp.]
MSKVLFMTVLMIFSSFPSFLFAQLTLQTPNVEFKLYLGQGKNQPLIVGLGGSEGGNAWASDYWKITRDQFLAKGYAFLALGYFGTNGTPQQLNKIAIDEVYVAIKLAAATKGVNPKKIAIVGGSRGGDLALLLGAHYPDISCVVALVPSHVAFPGNTNHLSTSAWTYQGQELSFVPVNEAAFPHLMKRDLRAAFTAMLQDSLAEEKALIMVEKIYGPIFLLSATQDEIAPTTPMCEKMMRRLKEQGFKHPYEHLAVEGGHAEPLKYFERVFEFLTKYYTPHQKKN